MKKININEYNKSMGILIDIQDPVSYDMKHHPDSINIFRDRLLRYHKQYLDKDKQYVIVCKNGAHSKSIVAALEYYGYDVTLALN